MSLSFPARRLLPLLLAASLPGCGMKGDLYLPPEPAEAPAEAPVEAPAELPPDAQPGPGSDPAQDQGERRRIPPPPEPGMSR